MIDLIRIRREMDTSPLVIDVKHSMPKLTGDDSKSISIRKKVLAGNIPGSFII